MMHSNSFANVFFFFDIFCSVHNDVTVGDIFRKMIELKLLTQEQASTHHLVPDGNAQASLELTQHLKNATDGSRFHIQPKPPSSASTQVILIKSLTEKLITISDCLPMNTIGAIKERIQFQEGIPPDSQRLIFNGKQLEDNRTLHDYGIENNSMLHLVRRLGKPVIRLKSVNNQIIHHVNLSIELDPCMWMLSSIYPNPSITNKKTFVQWNNMNVYPDGKIIFEKNEENRDTIDRIYPLIDDEKEYRMLFWEALTTDLSYDFFQEESLCVPRDDFGRILNYLLKK
jgi:hypothetical protein